MDPPARRDRKEWEPVSVTWNRNTVLKDVNISLAKSLTSSMYK